MDDSVVAVEVQASGLTSGKGGAVRLGCWTANSSLFATPDGVSNGRRTNAVLPLRVTAALTGPR